MNIDEQLKKRASNKCELCSGTNSLSVFTVSPHTEESEEHSALLCLNCKTQIENPDTADVNHWRCLNDSMWSDLSAVQVMAWRMLKKLSNEGWARDLLEQMYLTDETLQWAKSDQSSIAEEEVSTLDSNGAKLSDGDNVTLIKDLDVKGANFTAKRGTIVRRISLTDDPTHIEGRVSGQQIFLKTCFLKKA